MMKSFKHYLPEPAKMLARPIYRSGMFLMYSLKFRMKYGFWPPPPGTDLTGYESLIDFIQSNRICELEGDLLEIGTFLGGGAYKLSKYILRVAPHKRLWIIDIFDPLFDWTENIAGKKMAEIYLSHLRGRSQYEVFRKVTKNCQNIVVIVGDSKQVEVPVKQLCFAFIDGNHDPSYVENDFYLAWNRLVPGGVVAFDDYGYDLPQVTKTIDHLIERHMEDIARIEKRGRKLIFIQKKRRNLTTDRSLVLEGKSEIWKSVRKMSER